MSHKSPLRDAVFLYIYPYLYLCLYSYLIVYLYSYVLPWFGWSWNHVLIVVVAIWIISSSTFFTFLSCLNDLKGLDGSVNASSYEGLTLRPYVHSSVRPPVCGSVTRFFELRNFSTNSWALLENKKQRTCNMQRQKNTFNIQTATKSAHLFSVSQSWTLALDTSLCEQTWLCLTLQEMTRNNSVSKQVCHKQLCVLVRRGWGWGRGWEGGRREEGIA